MNSYYVRNHTYPTTRPVGSGRLSDTLSHSWMTTRECDGDERDDDIDASVEPDELLDANTEPVEQCEEVSAACETAEPVEKELAAAKSGGLDAYGCVYHSGGQRLTVTVPGNSAPIRFHSHSCLYHIGHVQDEAEVTVQQAGDYELAFDLRVSAKASAPVRFELRAGEEALPGGDFSFILSTGIQECRGVAMATLEAGDTICLVMTSVSVCEVSLLPSGVSASLRLKKLD